MKICFLDRDGVIIKDVHYLKKIKDIKFTKGVFEGLKRIQALNYKIYIVTNQSGIARGYLQEKKLKIIHNYIKKKVFLKKIKFEKIVYCPHHPSAFVEKYKKDCNYRKPKPGMIIKILKKNKNILKNSCFLIGDKISDIQAGKKAGLKKNFLIKKNSDFNNFVKKLISSRKIN
jgi:D-glycero-D-manno-heptose 1,7-bisphosphate phosphatase